MIMAPTVLVCGQCQIEMSIPACEGTLWQCVPTWQARIEGWWKEGSRECCGDCCRKLGNGYYEVKRLASLKNMAGNTCPGCRARGPGAYLALPPPPPAGPPPGAAAPPPGLPGLGSAAPAAAATPSSDSDSDSDSPMTDSAMDEEADYSCRESLGKESRIMRRALEASSTTPTGGSSTAAAASSAAAAAAPPEAAPPEMTEDMLPHCSLCAELHLAPRKPACGRCHNETYWIRSLGWTGSAGTSKKSKAYCPECSRGCGWKGRAQAMEAWQNICEDCKQAAGLLRGLESGQGPFQ